MKSIYVIEDNEILLDLLKSFLETEFSDMTLLGFSINGADAMQKCLKLKPDLVIADVEVPEVNGLEILHLLKMKIPETKIVIFTGKTDTEIIRIANHGHADGFVSKASGLGELENAIRALIKGGSYFSPDVFGKISRE
ncbi:response regulator [Cerasicoccus arenae]|uniref:Response regulatory domain-containing protein n=1 Tax=Cerasicoccus arenae TaxID=424488 RepID=A0A8J3D933_9BACT|nr:response regulator transcription factor [Cerasicoccus arenae]MBK1856967.1 response regulator transcription factor [Cerasicoccus arenae]GHB90113.1 hypothetical protein GCM10007047_00910 [Cerasicoccus arenae]